MPQPHLSQKQIQRNAWRLILAAKAGCKTWDEVFRRAQANGKAQNNPRKTYRKPGPKPRPRPDASEQYDAVLEGIVG